MTSLKSNLKAKLAAENISENELARRTGVSQQVINRLLSGENTNPKIGTLHPLAKYFKLTLSQLIGESISLQPEESGIPFIDWRLLDYLTAAHTAPDKTMHYIFETCLLDSSMEPKFYPGSMLIFDRNKAPVSGDFVLISANELPIVFRQFFKKDGLEMLKCLDPNHKDYQPNPLPAQTTFLGTLLQTRNHP